MVEKACTSRCHAANVVQRSKRTPTQWQGMVDLMIDRGAVVKDEDYDAILAHLSKQLLATVNINAAPADRIVEVLEASRKEAAAIVEYRGLRAFQGMGALLACPESMARLSRSVEIASSSTDRFTHCRLNSGGLAAG